MGVVHPVTQKVSGGLLIAMALKKRIYKTSVSVEMFGSPFSSTRVIFANGIVPQATRRKTRSMYSTIAWKNSALG
jgi:hypothetical protein